MSIVSPAVAIDGERYCVSALQRDSYKEPVPLRHGATLKPSGILILLPPPWPTFNRQVAGLILAKLVVLIPAPSPLIRSWPGDLECWHGVGLSFGSDFFSALALPCNHLLRGPRLGSSASRVDSRARFCVLV